MQIVNLEGNKINACFSFVVGNSEISVSTIFNKDRPEIAIFDNDTGSLLKDKLNSVSEAIGWVSSFGPRD